MTMSNQRSKKSTSKALQAILCEDSEDSYVSSSGDCSDFDADYDANAPEEHFSDDSEFEGYPANCSILNGSHANCPS